MEPRSQCLAAAPLIATWPSVLLAGAQINTFEQARSPWVHQAGRGPVQLVSPAGAWLHGAANQLRLVGSELAAVFGGHAEIEHGVDPNWHGALQAVAPPPGVQSPAEHPGLFTHSS